MMEDELMNAHRHSGIAVFRRGAMVMATAGLFLILATSGWAQNFSGDARAIGMGSAGEQKNFASNLAEESRPYRSIVMPLGLIQVLKDTDIFDPRKVTFDPVRAMEFAANPLHFTFNRNDGDSSEQLVSDLVNGMVSRDLNDYRGFIPARNVTAQGLLNPSWGKTFRVHHNDDGLFQGFYLGVGPYLAMGTNFSADPKLIGLLASSTKQYLSNTSFTLRDTSVGQAAAAVTVGYRAHFAVPGKSTRGSKHDGLYVAVNYNYLYGLHYEHANIGINLDTDSNGLITLQPTTTPVLVDRLTSSKGRGSAVDIGTHLISGRWNFRFAANGVGNRIDWTGLRAERYSLSSLLEGLHFDNTSTPAPTGAVRVELPVRYSCGGGYNADKWAIDSEMSRGLQGNEFHGGGEYRLGHLALRGGSRYSREQWNPVGGLGFNLTKNFGVDVAAFSTATNIERVRKVAMAVSLRFNRAAE